MVRTDLPAGCSSERECVARREAAGVKAAGAPLLFDNLVIALGVANRGRIEAGSFAALGSALTALQKRRERLQEATARQNA